MSDSTSAPARRFASRLDRLEVPAAALVALCSASAALGWLLQSRRLLQWLPGVPMVLAVALVLLVTSGLMLLRRRLAPAHQLLALRMSGASALAIGLAACLEWVTHSDLGIDFATLHVGLQGAASYPGRPSPEAGLALLLLGIGLAAQSFAHHHRARMLALQAFVGVGAIGAATLLARGLGLHLGLNAGRAQGLPTWTSGCEVLLSIALVAAWANVRRPAIAPVSQSEQLGVWTMSVLVMATASIALGALAMMQRQIEAEQTRLARTLIELRQHAMSDEIAHALAHGSAMAELLRALLPGDAAAGTTSARAWAEAFTRHPRLWHDNTSARLFDAAGHDLADFGRQAHPDAPPFALRGVAGASLLRDGTNFLLQTRVELDRAGHYLLLQQELPRVTEIMRSPALWPGQHSMLCRVARADTRCLGADVDARAGPPSPRFLAQLHGGSGASAASARLVNGLTWNGRPGMLASMPLASWGLELALVTPVDQAVAPVRAALGKLGVLFLVVAGLGTWALRGLIRPLSRRLDKALVEAQLHLEHANTAADTVQEALAVFEAVRDPSGRVTDFRIGYVNAAAAANLGATPADVLGRCLSELQSDAPHSRELFDRYLEVLQSGRPQQMESPCVGDGCGHKWLRRYIMKSGDGVFVIAHDITEARREAREMSHMALHDPLTGLPNRRSFEAALHTACRRAAACDSAVAVVFCDADDLKQLNDQRGHACGDEALREFARILRGAVRQGDLVARLAGDEFVVLLELGTQGDAADLVRGLRAAVDREIDVCGRAYPLRASVGWAAARGSQALAPSLLQAADDAMYQEKNRRKAGRMLATI